MTVPSTYTPDVSQANGFTTVFPYSFRILTAEHLVVEVDGVALSYPADYSVSGVGNPAGGNATLNSTPILGQTVIRSRSTTVERETDYQNLGDLLADTLNDDQDAPVMMIQEAREVLNRSLRLPIGTGSSTQLTDDAADAGRYIRKKLDGTGFELVEGTGSAPGAFIQSGAGAIARSYDAKLGELVSVKDFGATGNGVTDDTTAIQAAINYVASLATSSAEGATLRFPPGRYQISLPLNIADEMTIQGDGAESTKIQITSGTVFNVTSPKVYIRDIFILGPSGAASNGIKLTGGNNCIIERCVFENQTTAIELSASYAVEIVSCIFDVCYTYGIYSGTSCHNLMVERCGFFTVGVLNNGQAISLDVASDNIGIKDNDFEFCNVNIRLRACNSVEITGNYMEYHEDECFDFIATCTGIIIESNWIALGGAVSGGDTLALANITGGRFRHNTIFNQTVTFDAATLVGFTVGLNHKFGTGTLAKAPWITPTLLNSWAQQANYTAVGYIKDENGWVHLRGALVSGVAGTIAFTLPAAYRPAAIAVFATDSASGPGRITVEVDGDVDITVAASNNACLDGISFYVG